MRLLEAIIAANHRAVAGDTSAGLHLEEFSSELPVAALTCIDARLNPLLPGALGLPNDQFIWLRNAGNIITGPFSSTMRSLALACAVKGAKEIVIIGHSDCLVCKTSTMKLMEAFQALGVHRSALPENLTEYFGLFASERQNVIRSAETVRSSPLTGPKVPVHGLLLDVTTGRLEWIVNGYQTLEAMTSSPHASSPGGQVLDSLKSFAEFKIGEMKFPDTKIGEFANEIKNVVFKEIQKIEVARPQDNLPLGTSLPPSPSVVEPVEEKKIPLPPRIVPLPHNVRKWKRP